MGKNKGKEGEREGKKRDRNEGKEYEKQEKEGDGVKENGKK